VAARTRKPSGKSEQDALLAEAEAGADNFIDLSGVTAVRGGAVPAGRYLTEITAVKRGVTSANAKNPGAPKLGITFKVLENSEGEPASGTIFLHPVLTGEQAGRARGYLEDLGADLNQPFDPDDLIGTLVYLTVTVQKDNSNFNNVDKIELADSSDAGDVELA
jgi:hypothetical protein